MARRNFSTYTQTPLETELAGVEKQLLKGKTVVSVGGGDANVGYQVGASLEDIKDRILHDLHILDAATYPLSAIARDTVVRGTFP